MTFNQKNGTIQSIQYRKDTMAIFFDRKEEKRQEPIEPKRITLTQPVTPKEITSETRESLLASVEKIVRGEATIEDLTKNYPPETQEEIKKLLKSTAEMLSQQMDTLDNKTNRVLRRETNRRILVDKIAKCKEEINQSTKERENIDAEMQQRKAEFDEYMRKRNADKQTVNNHIQEVSDDQKHQEETLKYLLDKGEMPGESKKQTPTITTESI